MADTNIRIRMSAEDNASSAFARLRTEIQKTIDVRKTERSEVGPWIGGAGSNSRKASDDNDLALMKRRYAAEEIESNKLRQVRRTGVEQMARDQEAANLRRMRSDQRASAARKLQFGTEERETQLHVSRLNQINQQGGNGKGIFGDSLKETLSALRGGGQLIGLKIAGDMFEKMTGNLSDFDTKLATGQAKLSQMPGEIARSLPVLGSFVKGWDNVLSVLDGSNAAIAKHNKLLAESRIQHEENIKKFKEVTEFNDKWNRRGAVAGVATTEGGQLLRREIEAKQKLKDDLKSIDESQASKQDKDKARDVARKEFGSAQAEINLGRFNMSQKEFDAENERNKKLREDAYKEFDDRKEIQDKITQIQLEQDGKVLTARIASINAEADKRKSMLDRETYETGKDNAGQVKQSEALRQSQITAVTTEYQKERLKREQEHQQKLGDTKGEYAIKSMRLAGQEAEAERLQIESDFKKQLQGIEDQAREEMEKNAEDKPAIQRRAKEQMEAAMQGRELAYADLAQKQANEQLKFRVSGLSAISGSVNSMSGIIGQRGPEMIIDPMKQTAEAAKKGAEYQQQTVNAIKELVAAIQTGTIQVLKAS